jgi:Skp family chaperone for outer membrane proteins
MKRNNPVLAKLNENKPDDADSDALGRVQDTLEQEFNKKIEKVQHDVLRKMEDLREEMNQKALDAATKASRQLASMHEL